MLELENVVFRYARRSEPVLRGVSLTLNASSILSSSLLLVNNFFDFL